MVMRSFIVIRCLKNDERKRGSKNKAKDGDTGKSSHEGTAGAGALFKQRKLEKGAFCFEWGLPLDALRSSALRLCGARAHSRHPFILV